jgi:general secretion pathway protein C
MSASRPVILVWTLVLGSALSWAYTLTRTAEAAPAAAPAALAPVAAPADLVRLLGSDPVAVPVETLPPPVATTRMQLIGVISPGAQGGARGGLALIALNGQPAKVYRVGMVVDGNSVLQAVEARGAKLGPKGGPTQIALRTVAAGSGAAAEPQPEAAPVAAAEPQPSPPPPNAPPAAAARVRAAPPPFAVSPPPRVVAPSTPPPAVAPPPPPAPSADGAPPPFGGPPQAFGGAPAAQPRRVGSR